MAEKSLDQLRKKEEIAKRVNTLWKQYQRYARTKLDRYTALNKDYLSHRDPIRDATKSNSFIPHSFEAVDLVRSRFMEVIGGTRPYGRAIARRGAPGESAVTWLIDWEMEQDDFVLKAVEVLLSVLITGNAPYKVIWDRRYANVPQVEPIHATDPMTGQPALDEQGNPVILGDRLVYDDKGRPVVQKRLIFDQPSFVPISIWDFMVEPESKSIKLAEWAGERFWATYEEMEAKPGYDMSIIKREGIEPGSKQKKDSEARKEQREAHHLGTPPDDDRRYEFLEVCTDNRIVCVLADNNEICVRDDDNPYLEKFYHNAWLKPVLNEFFKLGLLESDIKLQLTMNHVLDDLMDQFNLATNIMFAHNEEASDENDYVARQGNRFKIKGDTPVDTALKLLQFQPDIGSALKLLQFLAQTYQTNTGVVEIAKGVPPPGLETATEFQGLMAQMSVRMKDMIMMLEYTFGKPLWRTFHRYNQIFMTQEQAIKVVQDGQILADLTVKPEEIAGDYDYEFLWSSRESFRSVQIQQAMQALQVSGQLVGFNPLQKFLAKKILMGLCPRHEREIEQALAETEQQAQQMAQAQGGGAPGQQVPGATGEQDITKMMAERSAPGVVQRSM